MKSQEIRGYTAAGAWPWKLLKLKEQCVGPDGRIVPMHIQLIPTNKCNGNCPWCSCSERDKSQELGVDEIREIAEFFARRGTKAVTITGGGEPTLHPSFLGVLEAFKEQQISIGMVTNGMKWGKHEIDGHEYISGAVDWIRVSTMNTAEDKDQPSWLKTIAYTLRTNIGVSFTVASGEQTSGRLAARISRVAQECDRITHIRFVQDILDPDDTAMHRIEAICRPITSKGIYQYRSSFTEGARVCRISRLKPMISADGRIYPCCGVQYANEKIGLRKMPFEFSMGHWRDYDHMKPFGGSLCQKCYYGDYNEALDGLVQPIQHIYHV